MTAVGRATSAAKLPSVGLWLNASKSESMLVCWRYFIAVFFVTLIFVLVNVVVPSFDQGLYEVYHKNNLSNTALKSIVDDFNMEPGVVSMGVVFVLRPAEIQPVFQDLSFRKKGPPPQYNKYTTDRFLFESSLDLDCIMSFVVEHVDACSKGTPQTGGEKIRKYEIYHR